MTQEEALNILKFGHNVFLTGAAGTGKTYVLNAYIDWLKQQKVHVAITASTGIAATHMGGMTIHSWSGIGVEKVLSENSIKNIFGFKRYADRFKFTDVLIIDEVSMLHAYQLDMVDQLLRRFRITTEPFGGMQVVISGDFFQLPPVPNRDGSPVKYVTESTAWSDMWPVICYLERQYRQSDTSYVQILNDIRNSSFGQSSHQLLMSRYKKKLSSPVKPTKLHTHNIDVDSVNEKELASLSGTPELYVMQSNGVKALVKELKRSCLAPEKLMLKKDAVVMFVKNNFEVGYVNGTLGRIVGFERESNSPIVETLLGMRITVTPATWTIDENGKKIAEITQLPLRLAWAITVHKSQGMTLDVVETDLARSFEPGMGYVALSRVRTLEGLSLIGINDTALKVSERVMQLEHDFHTRSRAAVERMKSISADEIEEKQQAFLSKINPTRIPAKAKSSTMERMKKKFPNAHTPWTKEEDGKLVEAHLAGTTVATLMKTFGRNPGAIRSRLKKLDLI